MKAKTIISLGLVSLLLVASFDVSHLAGTFSAALLVAFCISAYFAAMAHDPTRGTMMMATRHDDDPEMEVARLSGFGITGELKGRDLLSGNRQRIISVLGRQAVTNVLLFCIGIGLIVHHTLGDDGNKNILKEMRISNYLNTQPEKKRLEIGERMKMPNELSERLRPVEP